MPEHSCSLGVKKRVLINESALQSLMEDMHRNRPPVSVCQYTLCELYLDAGLPASDPAETLRLRSYGIPRPGDCVYLERAMQWDSISCIRRVSLTLPEAEALLCQGGTEQSLQAPGAMLGTAAIPRLFLAYERTVYSFSSPSASITLDRALRYRTEGLRLQLGDEGEPLLPGGYYILKTTGSIDRLISPALRALWAQPTVLSNFGYAYIAASLKERRGSI